MTNRKSHMRFRLVLKSTTLDDLEEHLRTLFQNTCSFGVHHENFNEDRPRDAEIAGLDIVGPVWQGWTLQN